MNNKAEIIKLYQDGATTQYVLEKELGEIIGERGNVIISSSEPAANGTSYAVFIVPEKRINGIYVNVIIDKNALIRYNPEDLVAVLCEIKAMIQRLLSEFTAVTFTKNAVTLSMVLKVLLEMYKKYYEYLRIDLLPDLNEINSVIEWLDSEMNVDSAIETLRINKMIPLEAIEIAKTSTHDIVAPVEVSKSDAETPTLNIWRTERMKYCNGISSEIGHTDIKYNYKPSTNQ